MNIEMLPGRLLVVRDLDLSQIKFRSGVVLHTPDDMQSSGVTSWAASDRLQMSGHCILHQGGPGWQHDPELTGMHVWWERYAEKEFTFSGMKFLVVPERAVFAYAEGRDEEQSME